MKSYILNGETFDFTLNDDFIEVSIPENHRKSKNTILVFEIKGNALDIETKASAEFKNLQTATLLEEPAEKFSGQGAKSLINKTHGTPDNLYFDWLGYEGKDFAAVIDLSTKKKPGCSCHRMYGKPGSMDISAKIY